MTNQDENQKFENAARAGGIRGEDHDHGLAIKHFSEYYHNAYPKWERENHSYGDIKEIAEDWWGENRHRYFIL